MAKMEVKTERGAPIVAVLKRKRCGEFAVMGEERENREKVSPLFLA